jgi:hypothetical protein
MMLKEEGRRKKEEGFELGIRTLTQNGRSAEGRGIKKNSEDNLFSKILNVNCNFSSGILNSSNM